MKKIIALVLLGGTAFWAYKSGALSLSGSGYRVEYSGSAGTKITGGYSWIDMTGKTPIHMEKVEATLPHSVSFDPPTGSVVSAAAMTLGGGSVTVKIFKGGVECGQPAMTGSAAMANMVCQP